MADKFKNLIVQYSLAAVGMICITILAALKIVSGDLALGVIAGAVYAVGVGGRQTIKKGGPPTAILAALLAGALLLGGGL